MIRFDNGINIDSVGTFGVLKFVGLDREIFSSEEEGVLKSRRYNLKSSAQGALVQVSLPAEVDLKEYDLNEVVKLVNPIVTVIATPTYGTNAELDYYCKADDIVKGNNTSIRTENKVVNDNKK